MLLILKIILVLFVVRALLMLLRGVMQGVSPDGGRTSPQPRGVQLVRDPVCGVYVTPSKAITERSGIGTAYFCSEKCRAAWKRR
jgi:YHS domain-containing protein